MQKHGRVIFQNENSRSLMTALPTPALAPFVEIFIELKGRELPLVGLPSFQSMICINLANRWSSVGKKSGRRVDVCGNYVLGHSDDMFIATFPEDVSFFFVKLKPGMASVLLKSRGSDLQDKQFDLLELLDVEGLNEFHSQSNFNGRVNTMQSMLIRLVERSTTSFKVNTIERAFTLLQSRTFIDIERLCDRLCVTYPTLRRYFMEQVGLSPKYCQKIIRFKKALQAYQKNGYTFNVHAFGYSDFSHFVKDTKAITSEPPRYFTIVESRTVQSNRSFSD